MLRAVQIGITGPGIADDPLAGDPWPEALPVRPCLPAAARAS
jgi:hypothetical protein